MTSLFQHSGLSFWNNPHTCMTYGSPICSASQRFKTWFLNWFLTIKTLLLLIWSNIHLHYQTCFLSLWAIHYTEISSNIQTRAMKFPLSSLWQELTCVFLFFCVLLTATCLLCNPVQKQWNSGICSRLVWTSTSFPMTHNTSNIPTSWFIFMSVIKENPLYNVKKTCEEI